MSIDPITCSNCYKKVEAERLEEIDKELKEKSYDLNEIRGLDVSVFRHADISAKEWLWVLVPVIGWIALAIIKCRKVHYHNKAEDKMKSINKAPYSKEIAENNIKAIEEAIAVAGSLAYQYQLTLAKNLLVAERPNEALEALRKYNTHKGTPKEIKLNEGELKNLIAVNLTEPTRMSKSTDGNERVFGVITHYHNGPEALLFAVAFAMQGKNYVNAHDAYNAGRIYTPSLSKFEVHQRALASAMKHDRDYTSTRKHDILLAIDRIRA